MDVPDLSRPRAFPCTSGEEGVERAELDLQDTAIQRGAARSGSQAIGKQDASPHAVGDPSALAECVLAHLGPARGGVGGPERNPDLPERVERVRILLRLPLQSERADGTNPGAVDPRADTAGKCSQPSAADRQWSTLAGSDHSPSAFSGEVHQPADDTYSSDGCRSASSVCTSAGPALSPPQMVRAPSVCLMPVPPPSTTVSCPSKVGSQVAGEVPDST